MVPHLLLGLLLVAQAPGGMGGMGGGFGGPSALYSIDGYLDTAPDEVKVLQEAELAARDRRRRFLIVSYWRSGGGNRQSLFRDVGRFEPEFKLMGPAADVDRIFDAAPGSRVHGTFKLRRGRHTLLINELTIAPPQTSPVE